MDNIRMIIPVQESVDILVINGYSLPIVNGCIDCSSREVKSFLAELYNEVKENLYDEQINNVTIIYSCGDYFTGNCVITTLQLPFNRLEGELTLHKVILYTCPWSGCTERVEGSCKIGIKGDNL